MICSLLHAVADGELGRAQRALHHGFHHHVARILRFGELGVLVHQPREQLLIERAPVDADAHRLVVLDGNFDHGAEVVVVLLADGDVAGIDAVLGQRRRAGRVLLQQDVSVVVEVADDGHGYAKLGQAVDDVRHGFRRGIIVDGHADQFRAGAGQRHALADGAVDVGGVGVGHRLHHNWCITADANSADDGGIGLPALNLSHTEV